MVLWKNIRDLSVHRSRDCGFCIMCTLYKHRILCLHQISLPLRGHGCYTVTSFATNELCTIDFGSSKIALALCISLQQTIITKTTTKNEHSFSKLNGLYSLHGKLILFSPIVRDLSTICTLSCLKRNLFDHQFTLGSSNRPRFVNMTS